MRHTHEPILLLTVRNLSYAYVHKKIFRQVCFDLYRSEIVVLQGPNGAGKTTLFKVLSGLLKPLSGQITPVTNFAGLSLSLQENFLYEDLSLKENLNIYRQILGSSESKQKELVQQFRLTGFYDQRVRFLSRGQRVRGALCRAFLSNADLFVLDEPLTGLDAVSSKRLLEVLTALRAQGKTVLMSTHSLDEIEPLTDRWMELNAGSLQVVTQGTNREP